MVGARGFEPPTPWSRTRCAPRRRSAQNGYGMPAGVGEKSASRRRRWIAYRHKQFSRDSRGNAGAVATPHRAGYNKEDEAQARARLLLPDDAGQPVSTLAISFPLTPTF